MERLGLAQELVRGRKVLFVGSGSAGIEGKAGQTNAWGQMCCPPGRVGDGGVGR